MKSILHKDIVLVVNCHWLVVNVITVQQALSMMIADAATGFDVQGADFFVPTRWNDWEHLPVREQDDYVSTPRKKIRVPRVIMAVNFAGVPVKEEKCTPENLLKRYGGKCAVSGVKLTRKTFSREHVVPRSKWKGDKRKRDGWENVVPAHREVNSKRGNKTYKDAGLPEPKVLPAPRPTVFASTVQNVHGFAEWDFFLGKAQKKV